MFDVGFTELALLGVLGLLVLGPERLPRVARTLGLYLRKARGAWYGLKSSIEQELAAEDLKRSIGEVKKESEGLSRELNDLVHPGARKNSSVTREPDSKQPPKAEEPEADEQRSKKHEPD